MSETDVPEGHRDPATPTSSDPSLQSRSFLSWHGKVKPQKAGWRQQSESFTLKCRLQLALQQSFRRTYKQHCKQQKTKIKVYRTMQLPALQLGAVLLIQLTEVVRALTNVFSVMLPIYSGKAFYLLFILLAPLRPMVTLAAMKLKVSKLRQLPNDPYVAGPYF